MVSSKEKKRQILGDSLCSIPSTEHQKSKQKSIRSSFDSPMSSYHPRGRRGIFAETTSQDISLRNCSIHNTSKGKKERTSNVESLSGFFIFFLSLSHKLLAHSITRLL
ncbi:hypothetical protein CP_0740 [Chlamydia pneumoniae AR39]|uniref:Uncharacterized protein n=1 Tax=Chlamydia pneumoniae TaxID=83558 RepID=Q9K1Z8_CHLPN|nr:hypothetical protein CP_0740 [Chlamydia pneumoniae AR39]